MKSPEVGKALCRHCWRKMEPEEYRAFYNEKENLNDIVCVDCYWQMKRGSLRN